MNELYETTILQEGLVRITNQRTLIGTQMYPLSDIKSVNVTRRGRSTRPLWVLLLGGVLLLWSLIDQTGFYHDLFGLGFVVTIAALVLAWLEKPSYVIQIRSGSGIRDILGSTDLSFIQRIVGAMNAALKVKHPGQALTGSERKDPA